jgi:UDP-N-acetylglucosamine 3-dehydrogenase
MGVNFMRIGILGTGFMGKMHGNIFRSFPEITLKGVVGRDASKAVEVANSLETVAYTTPYDLINSNEVDVIDVCYPTAIHAEYVVAALNKGKHVFCETPLAYNIEEAEQMLEAANSNGRILMVALYDRFQSQYKYICEYVKSGKLGRPKAVFANRRSQPYWSGKDMIVNLMIHDLDFLYWLLGKPNAVIGLGTKTADGINESINVLLEYDSISVAIEGNTIMPKSFPFSTNLRVVCEKGAIELNWHWGLNGPVNDVTLYPDEGDPEKLFIPDYDPYQAECGYFIDCVNGKADPELSGIETASNSLKIAVAARQSFIENGKKIAVL